MSNFRICPDDIGQVIYEKIIADNIEYFIDLALDDENLGDDYKDILISFKNKYKVSFIHTKEKE